MKIEKFKKNLDEEIDKVISNDREIEIETDNGNIMLISKNRYDSLLETIYLLS